MSRGRRRPVNVVEWFDESGTHYIDERPIRRPNPSIGQVPRGQRLAVVNCPAGHLIAVVQRPVGARPALLRVDAHAPVGVLALYVDGTFTYALVDMEAGTVGGLGSPRESVVVDCRKCSEGFEVDAAHIPVNPRANTAQVQARRVRH